MEELDDFQLELQLNGLWEEKSDESVNQELHETGSSFLEVPVHFKPETREKPELSIDDYAHAAISAEKSGRKIRLKRPYSESIWEIDVEQFKTFLDFYGAPVDSAENNQEKIKTIINALTSSVTVDQVSDEDVSFLLSRIRNVETVPKRGKGNGDYKCKICPKLLLNSDCYGLTNKENLKRHYQHHLQHHITRWKCSLCSHTHFRKDTLEQHLKRLHPCEIGEAIEL
ncbi:unnamed protein product [Oikopleura dioica]|uniref:C2H2-type domain-containing protein n=1 Tax=Oikopleura dioica TaxID=34765 RepID=E4Z106_OIKDI|nr:unnamed protein product [Oikopleura dioica]